MFFGGGNSSERDDIGRLYERIGRGLIDLQFGRTIDTHPIMAELVSLGREVARLREDISALRNSLVSWHPQAPKPRKVKK